MPIVTHRPAVRGTGIIALLLMLAGCMTPTTSAPTGPSQSSPPAGSPSPSLPQPQPTSAVATRLPTTPPTSEVMPLDGPLRVGIQVGHWKLEELPDEMSVFRKASGAYYRGFDEWEVNIEIARRAQRHLEAAGVVVDLLPATIPRGYRADAFVSVHADGVSGTQAQTRRGWKLATPWRASQASETLAEALNETYPHATGLPADPRGPSIDMRSYYAFASYRYWHAIAPTTPAVIIECGFMTHPQDRVLLFDQPDRAAEGIATGILNFLSIHDRTNSIALQQVDLPMLKPAVPAIALRRQASQGATVVVTLPVDERLVPLNQRNGWYFVTTRSAWDLGWVREQDVVAVDEPQLPPGRLPE